MACPGKPHTNDARAATSRARLPPLRARPADMATARRRHVARSHPCNAGDAAAGGCPDCRIAAWRPGEPRMASSPQAGEDDREVVLYVEDHPVNVFLMQTVFELRPELRLVVAVDGES